MVNHCFSLFNPDYRMTQHMPLCASTTNLPLHFLPNDAIESSTILVEIRSTLAIFMGPDTKLPLTVHLHAVVILFQLKRSVRPFISSSYSCRNVGTRTFLLLSGSLPGRVGTHILTLH